MRLFSVLLLSFVSARGYGKVKNEERKTKSPSGSIFHSSLFTFHSSFFTFHFSLFTLHFSLFVFHFSFFTFHFSLFVFHFSLFTFRFSLFSLLNQLLRIRLSAFDDAHEVESCRQSGHRDLECRLIGPERAQHRHTAPELDFVSASIGREHA